jgi:hypothetical protein
MKNTIEVVQNRTLLQSRLHVLASDRQRVLEECEMESIQVGVSESGVVDYSLIMGDIQDVKLINTALEEKEKIAAKYLSENLQLGLLGGRTD